MQIVSVKEKLKMYLKMMKSKVIKFCENCVLLLLNGLVIGLGLAVIAALGFAIYQSVRGFL